MTQDSYRSFMPISEILRETNEVKDRISSSTVAANGDDMERIIRESIEVGVRLCGFDIGYSNSPKVTSSDIDSADELPDVFSPEAQSAIKKMVEREEI